MKKVLLWAVGGAAAVFVALSVIGVVTRQDGFTDEDIASVRKSIGEEFVKRDGVQVTDVTMLREDARHLKGLVKLKIAGLDSEVTKSCSATMSDDGKNYLWSCP